MAEGAPFQLLSSPSHNHHFYPKWNTTTTVSKSIHFSNHHNSIPKTSSEKYPPFRWLSEYGSFVGTLGDPGLVERCVTAAVHAADSPGRPLGDLHGEVLLREEGPTEEGRRYRSGSRTIPEAFGLNIQSAAEPNGRTLRHLLGLPSAFDASRRTKAPVVGVIGSPVFLQCPSRCAPLPCSLAIGFAGRQLHLGDTLPLFLVPSKLRCFFLTNG
jgi:hypothetical protein